MITHPLFGILVKTKFPKNMVFKFKEWWLAIRKFKDLVVKARSLQI
jgi:hypothetical protein